MVTNEDIWMLIAGFVPLFASFSWMFLLLLGLRDSKTKTERGIKVAFLYYLIAFAVGYSLLTLYVYLPDIGRRFVPLIVAAFMFTPVLFYRLVWLFSDEGANESFPFVKHLSVALLLTLMISSWLFFVPVSVQSDLLSGGEVGADYHLLSLLFRYRPLIQFVFISMYVFLLLRRLIKYNRAIYPADHSFFALSRRMFQTIVVSFIVPVISALLLFTPQDELLTSPLPIVLVMFFVLLHSFVGYRIIRRGSIGRELLPMKTRVEKTVAPPVVIPKRVMRQIAERVENAEGKMVANPLTRKRFEEYIKERKPYLKADLKIIDLIEPLKANRTVISNFINKTYGLNFNQYINQLRIKELERLKNLPSNADKEMMQLLSKAGFSSMRNYKRAAIAQQDNQNPEI